MRRTLNPAAMLLVFALAVTPMALSPAAASADPSNPRPGRPELGKPGQDPRACVDGELLVRFKKDASEKEKDEALAKHGGKKKGALADLDVQVVEVPAGKEKDHAADYRKEPQVEFAEVHGCYYAQGTPNDPRVVDQWGFNNTGQAGGTADADIDAFEAWDAPGTGATPIAILDSGIMTTHEDLTGRVTQSKSFVRGTTTVDRYGHGTHVAGIAAAATNNAKGGSGTCPNCVLFNVKVLNDSGAGAWADIANGITWAANNGAKVINMSFGAYSPSATVESAVDYAWGKGVVLVGAAGNDGQNWGFYPAPYANVIAVGATTRSDNRWEYSNWGGNWIDVAAPGDQVLSTVINTSTKYESWSGTSMAAPHVSGIAGLIWSRGGCSTNSCVRDRIESTADPIAGTGQGFYDAWARGRVNACKALNRPSC